MDLTASVPRELRDKIEQELESGERIQWLDMPLPRFLTSGSVVVFLFGIPWTAFAVFMTGAAWLGTMNAAKDSAMSLLSPLFGLPFVLIGVAMLSSPLWTRRKAFRTVYAITDRRAISIEGGWWTTVRSYTPANLQDIHRKERRDGSGDIFIYRRIWYHSHDDCSEGLGFQAVRNVRQVEHMLRQLGAKARSFESSTASDGMR